jgi:argininosuccinate lyase
MVSTMSVHSDVLNKATPTGFALATDIAEWLVRRGVPFRDAHEIVGALVARCAQRGCELEALTEADLAEVSPHLEPEVRSVLSVDGALRARTTPGSTGPEAVAAQLKQVDATLTRFRGWAVEQVVPR